MLGVYVHTPFCVRKCNYCAFYSKTGREKDFRKYAQCVAKEALTYKKQDIDTIYFGGGTPSLIGAENISLMLRGIKEAFKVSKDAEITLEANPKTVTEQELCALKAEGVNRISFGFQSFVDGELSALGRIHTAKDGEDAVKMAKNAGFTNISGDIMTAIPDQSTESLDITIDKMLSLGLSHISAYSLTIEEGTPFYKQKNALSLPGEDTEREMYHHLIKRLKEADFEHYEISNFAKGGKRSRHNTKYWQNEPYIGLGAGAHSYFCGERYQNAEDIDGYLHGKDIKCNIQKIDDAELKKEKIMLGLRMSDGILYEKNAKIDKYIKLGYMERTGKNVRLTEKGIDISDYIFSDLM